MGSSWRPHWLVLAAMVQIITIIVPRADFLPSSTSSHLNHLNRTLQDWHWLFCISCLLTSAKRDGCNKNICRLKCLFLLPVRKKKKGGAGEGELAILCALRLHLRHDSLHPLSSSQTSVLFPSNSAVNCVFQPTNVNGCSEQSRVSRTVHICSWKSIRMHFALDHKPPKVLCLSVKLADLI